MKYLLDGGVVMPLPDICRRLTELAMRNEVQGRFAKGFLIGPKQAEELRDALGAPGFVDEYNGLPVKTHVGVDGIALIHSGGGLANGVYIADMPWSVK